VEEATSRERKRHCRQRLKPDGIPNWAYVAAGGCLTLAFAYVAFVPLVQDRDETGAVGESVDECSVPAFCPSGSRLGALPPSETEAPSRGDGRTEPAPTSAAPAPGGATRVPAPRPPAPPAPRKAPAVQEFFVSDLTFREVNNGHGPVERNQSNGEDGAGDGNRLTIGGAQFDKGLGVHAPSDVQLVLNARCTRFTAKVGVDDEKDTVDSDGRVVFRLVADGREIFESRPVDFTDQALGVDVDITGTRVLNLVVATAGDDRTDHADWADAKLTCTPR
jgi:hypothetical protein